MHALQVVSSQIKPHDGACLEQWAAKDWRHHFWAKVRILLRALQAEKVFQGQPPTLDEWLQLRVIAIAARPFMVLARACLGLSCDLELGPNSQPSVWFSHFQGLVQAILGLQRDLVGWEKNRQTNNQLHSILVLIRDGAPAERALTEAFRWHNLLVRTLVTAVKRAGTCHCDDRPDTGVIFKDRKWSLYVEIAVGFVNATAE